jgi:photosystem II stability/assembly factor-like uncharacterized protein
VVVVVVVVVVAVAVAVGVAVAVVVAVVVAVGVAVAEARYASRVGTASIALAAGAIAILFARPAAANGRFPQSDQIVFTPHDPNLIVARTTYGILPSQDNGTSWWYLCEELVGVPSLAVEDPEVALTANGALVVGAPKGLSVSTDVGCTWSCAGGGLDKKNIADVVVRPDTPDVVLALTSTIGTGDGGNDNDSRVFQSTDDGTTWTALGSKIDPTATVETIDVAKSDPNRIYVSAWRGPQNASRVVMLLVSMDGGQTWTERDVPHSLFDGATEDRVWIGGVDPTDANRVYLRSNPYKDGGKSRIYVTTDAGQTFAEIQSFDMGPAHMSYLLGEFLGFALSPDGSKIYFGSSQGGLFVADRATMKVTQTSPIDIHCLATRQSASGGTELWACGDESTACLGPPFLIGVSTDDGAHFTTKLPTVYSLCGPVACPNDAGTLGCGATFNGSGCGESYANFCQFDPTMSCGTCPSVDGGGTPGPVIPPPDCDGGADAGPSPPAKSSSCGCSAVGRGGAAGLAVSALVSLLVALGRRRRAR